MARSSSLLRSFGAALTAALTALTLSNPASAQVRSSLAACLPNFAGDVGNSSCVTAGAGNDPSTRSLSVFYKLYAYPGTIVGVEVEATVSVDVCYREQGALDVCPGDAWCDPAASTSGLAPATRAWVIYSKAHPGDIVNPGRLTLRAGGITAALDQPAPSGIPALGDPDYGNLVLPVDPLSASDSRAYYIRVNRHIPQSFTELGGACMNPVALASTDRVVLVGARALQTIDPTSQTSWGTPFPLSFDSSGFDVCANGRTLNWTGLLKSSPAHAGPQTCLTNEQADYMAKFISATAVHQEQVIQAQVSPKHRADANGGPGGGTCFPMHVFQGGLAAGLGGFANPGQFYVESNGETNQLVPSTPAGVPNSPPNAGLVDMYRLGPHELFHNLQFAWGHDIPVVDQHIKSAWAFESTPEAMAWMACVPIEPLGTCWSGAKLGYESAANAQNGISQTPWRDALAQTYNSAGFWLYVAEQYAYVPGTRPHPSGTPSQVPRVGLLGLDEAPAPNSGRGTDEGMDFLGVLFKTFESAAPTQGTLDLVDVALKDNLGRGLSTTLLDYHSMLYLKDYNSVDPRLRLDKVGAPNAALPLEILKPFPPLPITYVQENPADRTTRTFRAFDSRVVCPNPADPTLCTTTGAPFVAGASVTSSAPVVMDARGAAAISVAPDPSWLGLRVALNAAGTGTPPRFRLYRVVKNGTARTPVAECQGVDDTCVVKPVGSSGWKLSLVPLVDATTDEFILVASSDKVGASWEWNIGSVNPTVRLVSPTTSTPALVGHPSQPFGRTPLLVQAAYRDQNSLPIPIMSSSKVELRIPNCAAGGASCTLKEPDITVLPLAGGNVHVLATLPTSFYKPLSSWAPGVTTNDMDLQLVVDGVASDVSLSAVREHLTPATVATTLVLDQSNSMNGAGKLASLKKVAKLFAAAMVNESTSGANPQLGIVTFTTAASTLHPLGGLDAFAPVTAATLPAFEAAIDGINAFGNTSIGDGLFEAQSNHATAFDGGPRPDRQGFILISDGYNTAPFAPEPYYSQTASSPPGDDNGPWAATALSLKERRQLGLPTPVISAVAIGPDAATSVLGAVTNETGGVTTSVSEDLTPQFTAAFWTDAFLAGHNEIDGTVRFASGAGPDPELVATPIYVDGRTDELRVVVADVNFANEPAFSLRSPSGVLFTSPTQSEVGIAFRVPAPERGIWKLQRDSVEPYYVEAAGRSNTRLFGFAEVDLPATTPPPGFYPVPPGQHVVLRAVPFDGRAMPGCSVYAVVERPGLLRTYVLADHGKTRDGLANDGIYGAISTETYTPGIYNVTFRSVCVVVNDSIDTIVRETRASFLVGDLVDTDADGLPDAWESEHQLNPFDAADGQADLDGDGLSNLGEFQHGTNPLESDTDGGGESDGSEVQHGRNPNNDDDDAIQKPHVIPMPFDGGIAFMLDAAAPTLLYDVQQLDATGRGTPVPVSPLMGGMALVRSGMTNGVATCHRLRYSQGDTLSGWATICATAGQDVYPPRVFPTASSVVAHSRELELPLMASDEAPHQFRLLGLSLPPTSQALQMRVSFDPGFQGAAWVPYSRRVRLPESTATTGYVQIKDPGGNVTTSTAFSLTRHPSSLLDRAIAAEERAEDEILKGHPVLAKVQVLASLPPLVRATGEALQRCPSAPLASHLVHEVADILIRKARVETLLRKNKSTQALSELRAALEVERDLAAWADANGVRFGDR